MALERLAGPYTLTDGRSGALWTPYTGGIYLPGVGLVLPVAGSGHTRVVGLDGISYGIGYASWANYGLVADGTRQGYAFAEQYQGDYDVDPVTLMHKPGQINANTPTHSGFVRLPDRYIAPYGSNIITSPDGSFDAYTVECSNPGVSMSWSSWGDDPDVIVIGGPTGYIARYNWQTKQFEAGAARIADTSLVGLFYARDLNVYLSLKNVSVNGDLQCQLSIWSPRPRPASISTPMATPVVTAGKRSAISVTVRGSDNEPCPGEVVAWSLTGPGSLTQNATETAADGTATTCYDAPLDATGTAAFTASVGI